jgi:hypothetical protein
VALASPLAFVACAGDDQTTDPPASSATPAAPRDEPQAFGFRATRRCTDLINGLDYDVAHTGNRARLELVFAAVEGDEPDDDTKAAWRSAMMARRDQLVALQGELAALEPGDAEQDAWNTIVAAGAQRIALIDSRLAVLDGDWDTGSSTVEPDGGPSASELEAVEQALQALGIAGRDCRHLFDLDGNPPEHAEFLTSASSACATIVTRRSAGYGTDTVLAAVAAAIADGDVVATDALAEAVDASLAEWRATAEDLASVTTADVPDADGWQHMIDLAADRVQGFGRRAAALASGDQAEINAAFQPTSVFTILAGPDLAALGLQHRDCWLVDV